MLTAAFSAVKSPISAATALKLVTSNTMELAAYLPTGGAVQQSAAQYGLVLSTDDVLANTPEVSSASDECVAANAHFRVQEKTVIVGHHVSDCDI